MSMLLGRTIDLTTYTISGTNVYDDADYDEVKMEHLQSHLDEAETSEKETDHARKEPNEILDSNHHSRSTYEKKAMNMKHLSGKEDFENAA
ncbi:hypothetical protein TNCV_201141 [Trichonephila clavipes]|nr:hypothetical protein TNCV_201141 [Trichonephila clavipes]